jgi:hypothetical protein
MALFLASESDGITEAQLAQLTGLTESRSQQILQRQLAQRQPPLVTIEQTHAKRKRGRPSNLYRVSSHVLCDPVLALLIWETYYADPNSRLHLTHIVLNIDLRMRHLNPETGFNFHYEIIPYMKNLPPSYIAHPYPTTLDDPIKLDHNSIEHFPFIELQALIYLLDTLTDKITDITGYNFSFHPISFIPERIYDK